jgi:hypothetical protein
MLRELSSWIKAFIEVLRESEETPPWEMGSGGGSGYRHPADASLTTEAARERRRLSLQIYASRRGKIVS